MKPLYSRKELQNTDYTNSKTIMCRYLNKFINHRSEIRKIKWHEKDYFFEHLRIIKDSNNRFCYNLFLIPEAKEYLFLLTILLFSRNGFISFNGKVQDYNGVITPQTQKAYKNFFNSYFYEWEQELSSPQGAYLPTINFEYRRKVKEIENAYEEGVISFSQKTQRIYNAKIVFFYIYYKTRVFFDEMQDKYLSVNINGNMVIADIYTCCHVMSRHYFPPMNSILNVSLNDDIIGVDVMNLPESLLKLVESCSTVTPLTKNTEYYLLLINNIKHIIWLKFHSNNCAKKQCLQIRSFYKCCDKSDISKFIGKRQYLVSNNIYVVS